MKNTQFIHRLFTLLILVSFTFSINGCFSGFMDGDGPTPPCVTFLECHDGSIWRYDSDSGDFHQYHSFSNNLSNAVTTYGSFIGSGCYSYVPMGTQYSIQEHNIPNLTIRFGMDDSDYFIYTYTFSGNVMYFRYDEYSGDSHNYYESVLTDASSIDLDTLTICD